MATTGKITSHTKTVLKGFGIMGGTQIFTILCSIIRSKLVALWIGPAAFGLMAIYNGASELLTQITSLGVRSSAVRNVAAYINNRQGAATVSAIITRWGLFLAAVGLLVTIILSPILSLISFGDTNHTIPFSMLGIAVASGTIAGTQSSILQGTRQLKRLGKVTILSSIISLITVIPLFYFLRLNSIVLSVITYATVGAIVTWIMRERFPDISVPAPSRARSISVGISFIKLGLFITLSDILNQLAVYIFVSWLNSTAGEATTGYYQAGNMLFNRYVGIIFAAIATEYYPRLASHAHSRQRITMFVSHEMKIALWILLPIVLSFITIVPLLINILYTSDFIIIVPYVTIAIVGTIMRAISWCMSMVILARGDGHTFIITEGISAVIAVALNITGYILGGLEGLGFSYIAWYTSYTIIIAIVYRLRYRLTLNSRVAMLSLIILLMVAATATVTVITGLRWPALVATLLSLPLSYTAIRRS